MNLVLYNINAVKPVISTVIIKRYIMNLEREPKKFSYNLCLVGPLIIPLNTKYDANINMMFAAAEIKKFLTKNTSNKNCI